MHRVRGGQINYGKGGFITAKHGSYADNLL